MFSSLTRYSQLYKFVMCVALPYILFSRVRDKIRRNPSSHMFRDSDPDLDPMPFRLTRRDPVPWPLRLSLRVQFSDGDIAGIATFYGTNGCLTSCGC